MYALRAPVAILLVACATCWGQDVTASGTHTPGPYLVTVDYDALYQMPKPPEYEPHDFYGAFLIAVATQRVPVAIYLERPIPASVTRTTDVIFKEVDGVKLGLDIYQPSGDDTPNPLIVLIHGGYWKAGDKVEYRSYGIDFAALGYTAASVNYRLSGQFPFPAAVEDVRDAILHLTKHADDFNIDSNRVVVFGGSAGGHLAGFAGFTANTPGASYMEGVSHDAIKAIISIYGIHDLTGPDQQHHAFTRQFIGKTFEDAPDLYREASTITHVDKNDPPVLLIHGTLDASVPVWNSDRLSEQLDEAGVLYFYDRIDGWPHVMDFFSPIHERTLWQCYQFLKTHVPSDKMIERK